ncbi:MAG: preprotein translocase subunit SecY [Bacillota bacterium]|nr:preprotein translocase subunit SecY [Bacillota bacterium]
MFSSLRSALRIPDLRRRVFFTFWMLVVIRVGTHIAVPGIDTAVIREIIGRGALFGLIDLFSGGALSSFSVLAMSITPYITSSIVMQLLTMVIPAWEEMSKEDEGRRKLQQYGRYGTLILAMIQGLAMAVGLRQAVANPSWSAYLIIALGLTAGTVFLMWLGEQITEYGIGNGISLIIFAGIVSRGPAGLVKLFSYVQAAGYRLITFGATESGAVGILNILFLAAIGLLIIAAVVYMQEGERRIPVQYAKRVVGRKMYGGQSTHIPLKINQAGVIPVIFATSLLAFPTTVASFFTHPIAKWLTDALDYRGWLFLTLEFMLIILFTYFYTAMTFNPMDVSNNLKKYGGFIPGIRPGRPTMQFLDRALTRLTFVGALFLASIAIMPNFIMTVTGVPNVYFGGTALLIVVSVALETMKQIESHLLLRHYQGFLR